MIWRALAMWGASALNGGGGAPGRDLRSIPNIHWGGMLSNMGDPLNFSGGSGSNVLANMTNPAGFGAIHGDVPNNNVDPSAQPGYGQSPTSAASGAPGASSLMTGVNPLQSQALMAAYTNFMRNLGMPMQGRPMPPAPAPAQYSSSAGPSPNYSAMAALAGNRGAGTRTLPV